MSPNENGFAEGMGPVEIPEHQLLRRIGRGSYGQVWLARSRMGAYRAVKIVSRCAFKDQRPFEREWSGIRKFEPISRLHEGFVDVLQVGMNEGEGYFYYIMELGDDQEAGQQIDPERYVPKTLAGELSRRGRLSMEECLPLGLGLSQALAKLHQEGLVHRDIKPSNIIFVNGMPKLADIGLVADASEANSYVGTEGFIPPEGPGTPAADLYSLGKVLYEASTGKDRQDFPELPTQWSESAEYQSLLELNEVVLRCCKRVPAERGSAWDMHADLVVLLNGKSVRRLRALERRLARVKRTATIAGLALLLGGAVSFEIYRELRAAAEARRREVSANVFRGNQAMEAGDYLGALPYFVEGLRLDSGDRERESTHRLRVGMVLAQCPRLTQMWPTAKRVYDAEFSPDGKRLVMTEYREQAQVRDVQTGELVLPALGKGDEPRQACYSPDGRFIIGASHQKAAIVWDAHTGQELFRLPHTNHVLTARFSPAGDRILTCWGQEHGVFIWNVATRQVEATLDQHSNTVCSVQFSHNGQLIVTTSWDHTARLWYATNGQPTGMVLRHDAWVNHASFSHDDQRLVTASDDHTARVWDLTTGKQLQPVLMHDDVVRSAEFSPDDRLILTGSLDGTVRLWRAVDLQPVASNPVLRHGQNVNHACFSPDGRLIASACNGGSARIWDLAGATQTPESRQASLSKDGSSCVVVSNGVIEVIEVSGGPRGAALQPAGPLIRAEPSFDGRFLAAVSQIDEGGAKTNCLLEVFNVDSGQRLGAATVPGLPAGLASSDDGRRCAVFSRTQAFVYEVARGTEVVHQFSQAAAIRSVVFDPSGERLAVVSGKLVQVWDCATGVPCYPALEHPVPAQYAEFSRDGRLLVTCATDDSTTKCSAQVWNAKTGQPVGKPLRHDDGVLSASFSNDGKRVVTASEDFTARVWAVTTGKRIGFPLRHRHQVRAGGFSPDARWVATASVDHTARLWDAETSDPLCPPLWHFTMVSGVWFVPGGRELATIDGKGRFYRWPLAREQRSVPDLQSLIAVLGGSSVDSESGTPPTPESIAKVWQRLRTLFPASFTTSREEIAHWHDCQAQASALEKQWFAARFHLRHLLELRPSDSSVAARLAEAEQHLAQ